MKMTNATVLLAVFLCFSTFSIATTNKTLPVKFLLGYATASYQVEGAWNEEGKGENIWDRFTHTRPDMIAEKDNGDITCDQYHKYEEDVQILKDLHTQIYRFSISWSRIFPSITNYQVNKLGVMYYSNLINSLLKNGIQPMVTLYHWDLPQYLQDLGGWTNPVIIQYYVDYAKTAFALFGDRVHYWITFNEPLETCKNHYGEVDGAPALNLSGIADYLCAHHILQAHAHAYHVYNKTFKPTQKGIVGITLNGGWNAPLTTSRADKKAADTMNLFQQGWFADPIFSSSGDYPVIMRKNIDANSATEGRPFSRLPRFNRDMVKYIRGTFDFFGLNHYSTKLASFAKKNNITSYMNDAGVQLIIDPSWPKGASPWLQVVPWGFRKILNHIRTRYNNPPVFVTENGYSDTGGLDDLPRIKYYNGYISEMLKAMYEDGCNVLGYISWSILDNFEWRAGFTERFGVYSVNFTDPSRTRTAKKSAEYMKKFFRDRELPNLDCLQ